MAPSPTGALHLGNARTFLVNWALARQRRWRVAMRIEDLDGPRVKPGAQAEALDVLAWLGLDWDGPVLEQSRDLRPYRQALARLGEAGLIYPCRCTRREIEQAQSAPHEEGAELRYPGTCRPPAGVGVVDVPAPATDTDAVAWRLRVPAGAIAFDDAVAGPQRFDVLAELGDFVVATKQGLPAYQLAVVVDDMRQGVTDIVRGDDLLASAARQLRLYELLDPAAPRPTYHHLPLVVGPDGRRLAKRHGDTRLTTYREHGVAPQRIVGLIARWCGVVSRPMEMSAAAFADAFEPARLPREPIVMTPEDERWLLSQS